VALIFTFAKQVHYMYVSKFHIQFDEINIIELITH